MLGELLADILTSLSIATATQWKRKLPYYLLGLFSIFVAVLPGWYYFAYVPIPKENYQAKLIEYSKCYVSGEKVNASIVLETAERKYFVPYRLWGNKYSEAEVLAAFKLATSATVWLGGNENTNVKGAATKSFQLDPGLSESSDNSNHRAFFWLTIFFAGLGGLLIIVVYFSEL